MKSFFFFKFGMDINQIQYFHKDLKEKHMDFLLFTKPSINKLFNKGTKFATITNKK